MTTSKTLEASPIVATAFKIQIEDTVYHQVMHWVHKSDHEVSGFGTAIYQPETNTFLVTKAFLLEQENGPTSSEIDPAAMGKAMFQMKDEPNAFKWWWHSHVNMQVFWSSDDMNCIRGLGQQSWVTATVFNKRAETRSAFYDVNTVMGQPNEVFIDDIPTSTIRFLEPGLYEQWDKAYEEAVKEKKYTPTTNYNWPYPGEEGYEAWEKDTIQRYEKRERPGTVYDASQKRKGKDSDDSKHLVSNKKDPINGNLKFDPCFAWSPMYCGYVYNPVKDMGLNVDATVQEIRLMEPDEFDALMEEDTQFKNFVRRMDIEHPLAQTTFPQGIEG